MVFYALRRYVFVVQPFVTRAWEEAAPGRGMALFLLKMPGKR